MRRRDTPAARWPIGHRLAVGGDGGRSATRPAETVAELATRPAETVAELATRPAQTVAELATQPAQTGRSGR